MYEGLKDGKTFEETLRARKFEPDAPNFTPLISVIMNVADNKYDYALSILKSGDGNPEVCERFTYTYDKPVKGEGRFIHTYMGNGEPLPSFEGEPVRVDIKGNIDEFTSLVWENLNEDNKVSLFVRFINIEDGSFETRIVNKNVR